MRLAREPRQTLLSVIQGLKAALKVERRERARSQKETAPCSDYIAADRNTSNLS